MNLHQMKTNSNIRIQNLLKNLQKDSKSIFYAVENLSRTILNNARKSIYDKDKVFVNSYNQLEDKIFYQNNDLPLVTPLVNKRSNIDHSILYSISKPFDLLHTDIADLRWLAKSAVDPKYCLLVVHLFTSKIYIYPMKNRSLLAKKLKLFYEDVDQKGNGRMRLQTDLEFKQNQIKKLNDEFNVEMFQAKVPGGKAFAAEQKIREFKKILLRSKRFEKLRKKRLKPIELIKKAAQNMNEKISTKYQLAPETIEKSLNPNMVNIFKKFMTLWELKRLKTTKWEMINTIKKLIEEKEH